MTHKYTTLASILKKPKIILEPTFTFVLYFVDGHVEKFKNITYFNKADDEYIFGNKFDTFIFKTRYIYSVQSYREGDYV